MGTNLLSALAGALSLAFVMSAGTGVLAAEIQWFGQAAFKITTPGGKVIMIDPFLTNNPKTPKEHKDLARLGKVDLILVTHGHGDHIGDTYKLAAMTGAKVALNADMGSAIGALGLLDSKNMIRFTDKSPGRSGMVQYLTITIAYFSRELSLLPCLAANTIDATKFTFYL